MTFGTSELTRPNARDGFSPVPCTRSETESCCFAHAGSSFEFFRLVMSTYHQLFHGFFQMISRHPRCRTFFKYCSRKASCVMVTAPHHTKHYASHIIRLGSSSCVHTSSGVRSYDRRHQHPLPQPTILTRVEGSCAQHSSDLNAK